MSSSLCSEEQGEERRRYPYDSNHNGESSVRMGCGSIFKAILHCFGSVFNSPRKTPDRHVPVLPIQNPASVSRSNEENDTVNGQKTGHVVVPIPDFTSENDEIISSQVVEERWIKHYCSRLKILLVGDGDFSFSASLADAFGSASNIIATSLDSEEFLKRNYSRASSNIEKLRKRESMVMHEIDATQLANHPLLGHLKFDRIVFNFPFAGFFTNLTPKSQLRRHRRLVSLFLNNAREMICEDGEIHISHKTNGTYHAAFKLELVASSHRLRLIEAIKFDFLDYPGYHTNYGFGGDNNFNCNPSKTFKFGLDVVCKTVTNAGNSVDHDIMF